MAAVSCSISTVPSPPSCACSALIFFICLVWYGKRSLSKTMPLRPIPIDSHEMQMEIIACTHADASVYRHVHISVPVS